MSVPLFGPVMERLTSTCHEVTPYDVAPCVHPHSINGWCPQTQACGLTCRWEPESPDG